MRTSPEIFVPVPDSQRSWGRDRIAAPIRNEMELGAGVDGVVGTLSEETVERLGIPSLMAEGSRRFPPPWRADRIPGGYVVRDANGQSIAYIYSRENEDEARQAKVLTKDEARRVAINIARLPELLGGTA